MSKKAFTLIELLTVIAVLGIILTIAIPTVQDSIDDSRQKSYNTVVKQLLKGAKRYLIQYKNEIDSLEEYGIGFVTINELINKGIIATNIINPLTKTIFPEGAGVKITKLPDANYKYDFFINGFFIGMCGEPQTDFERPTITFGTNGNIAYSKSASTSVTAIDVGSGINISSLKYQWTTSIIAPTEGSFNTSFANGENINTPQGVTGEYYLWILASDFCNNIVITSSQTFYLDNTPPVITLLGSNPITIVIGSVYNDAGATAIDNIDGAISGNIQQVGTVNPNIAGTYTVTYNVSDSSGNAASPGSRTVNVVQPLIVDRTETTDGDWNNGTLNQVQSLGNKLQLSGFFPDDMPNLSAWYKADSIIGLTDGQSIETWSDISGNGRNLTQTTAANRPVLKINILNGKNIVRFSRSDSQRLYYSGGGLNQPITVFIVWKCNNTGTSPASRGTVLDGMNTDYSSFLMAYSDTSEVRSYAGIYNKTVPFGNFIISSAVFNAGSSLLKENGVFKGTGSNTYGIPNGITIGGRYGQLYYLNGDVAEIIIYNTAMSTENINKVEDYLSSKYAIGSLTNYYKYLGTRISPSLSLNNIKNSTNSLIQFNKTEPNILSNYYNNGTENINWAEGYSLGTSASNTQSKQSDHLHIYVGDVSAEQVRTWVTDVPVDLTNISKLKITWNNYRSVHNSNQSHFVVSTEKMGNYTTYNANFVRLQQFALTTDEMNVSSLSGHYYIRVHARSISGYTSGIRAYKIWGEDASGNVIPIYDTNVKNYALVTSSATTPSSSNPGWQLQTHNQPLTVINNGTNYSGKYLWLKQELSTTGSLGTPQLHDLYVKVEGLSE